MNGNKRNGSVLRMEENAHEPLEWQTHKHTEREIEPETEHANQKHMGKTVCVSFFFFFFVGALVPAGMVSHFPRQNEISEWNEAPYQEPCRRERDTQKKETRESVSEKENEMEHVCRHYLQN